MRRFLLATAALAALWALAVTPARAQSSDPGLRSAASSDTDVVRDKSPVNTAKKTKPPARVVRRPPPPPPPPYPPPAYGYYAGPPGPYWGGYPYWRRPYWGPYAYGPYYRPYYRPFPFLPFIW